MSNRRRTSRRVRRPSEVLQGLRGELVAHLRQVAPDVPADLLIETLTGVVGVAERDAGLTDLLRWGPAQIDHVLAVGERRQDEGVGAAVLGMLLTFLTDTGRWEADPELLDRLGSGLRRNMSGPLRDAARPHADTEDEARAIDEHPGLADLRTLLSWLGSGPRPVTGTGALRRKDAAAVLAALGVRLGARQVQSMWEHPELSGVWREAVAQGYLIERDHRAARTPAGAAVAQGDAHACRRAVAVGFGRAVRLPRDWFADGLPLGDVAELAMRSLRGTPTAVADLQIDITPPTDPFALLAEIGDLLAARHQFDHPAPEDDKGLFDADELWDAPGERRSAVPRLDPTLPRGARLLAGVLLATGGFVLDDGRLRITPGLEAVVANALADLLDGVPLPDGDTMLGGARARGDVDERLADLADADVRLTVALDRVTPKVWRQVQLPATSTLGDLHALLNAAFDRSDDHLHEFVVVDETGDAVTAADDRREADEHEDELTLAEVLPLATKLLYTYDLGAEWTHRIELDGVVARDARSPRVTAGKNSPPAED